MSHQETSNTTATMSRSSSRRHGELTAKLHARHVVVHDYVDHATTTADMIGAVPPKSRRGGVVTPFPQKLHQVLEQVEKDGFADCISWQPHGRCFMIHKPKDFVAHVMPKYFNQTKLTSFQRQLNLYGFQRLTKGPDANAYYHSCFLRGKPFLTAKMARTRVKGTKIKGASNPEQEPDFYAMVRIEENAYYASIVTRKMSSPSVCFLPQSQPPLCDSQATVVTSDDDEETFTSQSTYQNDAAASTSYRAEALPQLLPTINTSTQQSNVFSCTSLFSKSNEDPVAEINNDDYNNNKKDTNAEVPIPLPELSGFHSVTVSDVTVSSNPFQESEENSHFDPATLTQVVPLHPAVCDTFDIDDPVDAMIMGFRQENQGSAATTCKGNPSIMAAPTDDATLGLFLDAMMNDPIFDGC